MFDDQNDSYRAFGHFIVLTTTLWYFKSYITFKSAAYVWYYKSESPPSPCSLDDAGAAFMTFRHPLFQLLSLAPSQVMPLSASELQYCFSYSDVED